jgi:hypothetical protein
MTMIRLFFKLIKWLVLTVVLVVIAAASPVAYVEFACRGSVIPNDYKPLITDTRFQLQEANTYLNYPGRHVVYAYDGLAETLKTGDEYQFDYIHSINGFWSSTCKLMKVADAHGGADPAARMAIYATGARFDLEMGLKAAYEETLGRLSATIRGPQKTPQDEEALQMAVDYAAFLRQAPWYGYDFDKANEALWAAPMTDPVRGWERRLALGGEWKAKAYSAKAVAAAVDAKGQYERTIRSVVTGLDNATLKAIPDVTVISDSAGGTVIETPRDNNFTHVLATIAAEGGSLREIAGNDDVMVSVTIPADANYGGPGEVISDMERDGFQTRRLLLNLKVSELANLFKVMSIGDPGIEHVFDY